METSLLPRRGKQAVVVFCNLSRAVLEVTTDFDILVADDFDTQIKIFWNYRFRNHKNSTEIYVPFTPFPSMVAFHISMAISQPENGICTIKKFTFRDSMKQSGAHILPFTFPHCRILV